VDQQEIRPTTLAGAAISTLFFDLKLTCAPESAELAKRSRCCHPLTYLVRRFQ
jgi:hypothetical protein